LGVNLLCVQNDQYYVKKLTNKTHVKLIQNNTTSMLKLTSKLSCFLVAQLVKEGVDVDCSLSAWLVFFFIGESGLLASSLMPTDDVCFTIGIRCDSKLDKTKKKQVERFKMIWEIG